MILGIFTALNINFQLTFKNNLETMTRLSTKEDRLKVLNAQIEWLTKNGYSLEEYKGLKIFTTDANGFYLKIFKDTSSNHILFKNYYSNDRRQEAINNVKANYDRNMAYKEECKNNKTKSTAANCAAAIREELKTKFKHTKFSVTSENFSMGNSVRIKWTDGPTEKEVESITNKYQYGHFNGMEDMYEYSNSREDIPQAKYAQTSREIGEATKQAILPTATEFFNNGWARNEWQGIDNFIYQIWQQVSIPEGATNIRMERTQKTSGLTEDLLTISYDLPIVEEVAKPEKIDVPTGQIQVIEYSDKSIAVIGDTKPIKDKLKELGGKFNFRLTCGAGWIFPKTKLSDLQTALS